MFSLKYISPALFKGADKAEGGDGLTVKAGSSQTAKKQNSSDIVCWHQGPRTFLIRPHMKSLPSQT